MTFIAKIKLFKQTQIFLKEWYSKFTLWLGEKSNKEKIFFIGTISLTLIFILYYSVIATTHQLQNKNEKSLLHEIDTGKWIVNNTVKAYRMYSADKRPQNIRDKIAVIRGLAMQYELSISKIETKESEIAIWMNEVAYQKVLQWMLRIENEYKIGISNISMSRVKKNGCVTFCATFD